jgi:L-lactate dehydrogenase complex protein LldE
MVRHYYEELFADDPTNLKRAQDLAARSYEFTQFVVDVLGVNDLQIKCENRVTYHSSCHGARILGAKTQALTLLRNVKGIDLVLLPNAQDCCGFGGAFSVKLGDISAAMAAEKTAIIDQTGADILVASDMGCLMHLGGYLKRQGRTIEVMHVADFFDKFGVRARASQ